MFETILFNSNLYCESRGFNLSYISHDFVLVWRASPANQFLFQLQHYLLIAFGLVFITHKIELDFRLGTQNTSHLYCCTLNPQSKVCISPSLHFFFFDLLIGQKRNLMYVKFTALLSSMESDQFN